MWSTCILLVYWHVCFLLYFTCLLHVCILLYFICVFTCMFSPVFYLCIYMYVFSCILLVYLHVCFPLYFTGVLHVCFLLYFTCVLHVCILLYFTCVFACMCVLLYFYLCIYMYFFSCIFICVFTCMFPLHFTCVFTWMCSTCILLVYLHICVLLYFICVYTCSAVFYLRITCTCSPVFHLCIYMYVFFRILLVYLPIFCICSTWICTPISMYMTCINCISVRMCSLAQIWRGAWQDNEIVAKFLSLNDPTVRMSRDFNEEYPRLRWIMLWWVGIFNSNEFRNDMCVMMSKYTQLKWMM